MDIFVFFDFIILKRKIFTIYHNHNLILRRVFFSFIIRQSLILKGTGTPIFAKSNFRSRYINVTLGIVESYSRSRTEILSGSD